MSLIRHYIYLWKDAFNFKTVNQMYDLFIYIGGTLALYFIVSLIGAIVPSAIQSILRFATNIFLCAAMVPLICMLIKILRS
ncbi:hypothetical protein [Allofustis seminis]|uniref:hypothetical protein n=1 Tax=Allofustis seminis TaxID=166939 RepID=UPI00037EDFAC|nr:hypothetical protein [Allofustis seminis]